LPNLIRSADIPNGACLQLGIGGIAQRHRRPDRQSD